MKETKLIEIVSGGMASNTMVHVGGVEVGGVEKVEFEITPNEPAKLVVTFCNYDLSVVRKK